MNEHIITMENAHVLEEGDVCGRHRRHLRRNRQNGRPVIQNKKIHGENEEKKENEKLKTQNMHRQGTLSCKKRFYPDAKYFTVHRKGSHSFHIIM